ncbi:MAG: hypothetical protein ACW99F_16050 [Candidatus Hodarchaeales archaeon]|jgi:hypothetical protein
MVMDEVGETPQGAVGSNAEGKSNTRGVTLLVIPVVVIIIAAMGYIVLTNDALPNVTKSTSNDSPFVGESVSPGVFDGDLHNLPTTAPYEEPPQFEGDIKDVKVGISKGVYKRGELITITVSNESVFSVSHIVGPGCDIVFERKVGGNWEKANIYAVSSRAPCRQVELESGEEWEITVEIVDDALLGTYRAAFSFHEKRVTYSSEFQIY